MILIEGAIQSACFINEMFANTRKRNTVRGSALIAARKSAEWQRLGLELSGYSA